MATYCKCKLPDPDHDGSGIVICLRCLDPIEWRWPESTPSVDADYEPADRRRAPGPAVDVDTLHRRNAERALDYLNSDVTRARWSEALRRGGVSPWERGR